LLAKGLFRYLSKIITKKPIFRMLNRPQRRILISTTPGSGHLNPLLPVAHALAEAGHEVAFAARPFLADKLNDAGFRFFAVGSDREADPEYQAFKAERDRMPTGEALEHFIYTRLFCGIMPRLYAPGLVAAARGWKPDLLLREAAEYSAVIAADVLQLPHATVAFTTALHGMDIMQRDAASQLDPLRRVWGLAPDPSLAALYRNLYLAFTPPTFGAHSLNGPHGSNTLPATTRFVRPTFFDRAAGERLPTWFADLAAQPNVYVTLGSEVNNEPDLYPRVMQSIIAGLRDLPVNLIVTLGRDKDPADFGPQPANVHIERYIPQSLLLKHCDVMVMHAGSNSVLGALDEGLPLVLVPLIADQFYNAEIAGDLGLAQVVPLDALTPERIRAAVRKVLENPSYAQNMTKLQTEMHNLPPVSHAVELIEQVIETRAGGIT